MSDGAAAVVLCPLDMVKNAKKRPILIAGFGQATDTHALQEREDPTDLKAVTLAAWARKMVALGEAPYSIYPAMSGLTVRCR